MKYGTPFLRTLAWLQVATSVSSSSLEDSDTALKWRGSLVHKNPGEGFTPTKYSDPPTVSDLGYNVMIKNDGAPPHAAITWDSFDPDIFPEGSDERQWVEDLASTIDENIKEIKDAGMKSMYWFDMFVLPKALVDKHEDELTDDDGDWSFDSDMMVNVTEYLLDAVFERFPDLDGLLIRTGEIFTNDVPYHDGASPITDGSNSHIKLLQTLQDVVMNKHNKLVFYRTWAFDGFTTDPDYYLDVANAVDLNPNLWFVIKHTSGDFWRTAGPNPTVDLSKHPYLIEIQCQREYEGKGAFPNYVMNGVIEGFEEDVDEDASFKSLSDIRDSPLFQGVVTWARGGGWEGVYPANEFWIDMNVRVIAKWAQDPSASEPEVFEAYARELNISSDAIAALRDVALLSARGTLYGHYSLAHQLSRLEWTRDRYIGGADNELKDDFDDIISTSEDDDSDIVSKVLEEKALGRTFWEQIVNRTEEITIQDSDTRGFILYSVQYAQLLYRIIEESWVVSLTGMSGDNDTGSYDTDTIKAGIEAYDNALADYEALGEGGLNSTGLISTLYTPTQAGDDEKGANNSVNMWRWVVEE